MAEGQFKLRVAYKKDGRLRYLGHLEFLRTADRSIRRSGLPFAVTQGYKPHMRIAFSGALPVGVASRCEYYDLVLDDYIPAHEALEALRTATPADLLPYACGYVDMREPALEAWLNRSSWSIALIDKGIKQEELFHALAHCEASGSIEQLRKNKSRSINLSDTLVSWKLTRREAAVKDIHVPTTADSILVLELETRSGQDASLRPHALLAAALKECAWTGNVDAASFVMRTALVHESNTGKLVDALSCCTGTIAQYPA